MTIDALRGIRVVEVGTSVGGAYAGKLFADAGADVVILEEDAGSPLRRLNRRGYAEHDSGDQPMFRWLAAGKRSARAQRGSDTMDTLLRRAHVVVSELPPDEFDELGLLPNPSNVVVTISPYGRGLLQSTPGNDFTAHAISGSIAARGLPEREPIYPAGRITELGGGTFAAAGALGAVHHLVRTGQGAHIDASCAEAAFITSNLFFDLMFRMLGFVPPIPGRMVVFPGIERTADGWIGLNTNSRQKLEDLVVLVGREDLLGETDLRSDPDRKAQFEASTKAYLEQHTTEEILDLATAMRIPVAPVGNGELLPTFDHFIERGIFTDEPYGNTAPRPHYTIDGVRPRARAAAPTLADGKSPDDVAAEWESDGAQAPATTTTDRSELPLAGLKVVDLTAWWAGPSATQLLAALGADVIHIESIQVIDAMRPAGASAFAATPDWWERSCFFLSINPNKRDITLDLSTARGRELLMELIDWADVLVENFTPRVLASWGITWEKLHERNPGLIMCRMPAFGLDGPWSDRVGFAQTVEQVSGLSWATGYADGPPITPNGPCDPLGGMHSAFAIMVALRQREQTGTGCLIEAPLVESALNLAAEELLEYSAFGLLGERLGNRSRQHAPQGVYRCAGDDSWIALSVDDETWPALVRALGEPDWSRNPALATVAGRFEAHDEIDAHLNEWFAPQKVEQAVEALTSGGVAAAPVVDHRDVVTHPLFEDRGFAEWIDHPVTGRILVTAMPFRHSRIDRWLRRPAPTLGQHNHEVLSGILGLDEAAIAELEEQKVIGTRPLGL
jgi:crotonobetainyl-CoA:carnitine CoA-transferase CaiB-like acyl-CoA transferase